MGEEKGASGWSNVEQAARERRKWARPKGERLMRELILYSDDFKSTGMWHHVLDMVGVESHATVGGKVIDRNVETITIRVHSAHDEYTEE